MPYSVLFIFILLFQFECFLFKICIFNFTFFLHVYVCDVCLCVHDVCSCVWLWVYSYEAHVWRLEGSVKNQSITHLTPCLRQGLSFILSVQGQQATTSTITSHLAKECWNWRCVPLLAFCGFWALKLRSFCPGASTLLSESFSQSLVLMYSLSWF